MARELPIDTELLLGHAGWMRALAASLIADPASVDDVVQDTWVALLRHAPRADRPLEPWLARVVENFAWKRRRAEGRRAEHEQRVHREPAPSPVDTIERLELQRILVEAVLALDEPYRTTVFLHYFEGRTSKEIARSHEVPAGTVRWRLQRGLERLRARLDGKFGARSAWGALLLPIAEPHEAAPIGTGGLAGAGVIQGVVAMGLAWKLCLGVAGIAAVGAVWWSRERAPLAPLSAQAPAPVVVEADTDVDDPVAALPETSTRATAAIPPPVAAPELEQDDVVVADVSPPLPGRVDARFVDSNGLPRANVRFDCPGAGSTAMVTSGDDGRAELSFDSWRQDRPTLVESIDVRARLEGCATVILRATVRSGELTHLGDVVLVPGVTLRGRIVDPDGIGVEGARVGVAPVDLYEGSRLTPDVERTHRHGSEHFGRHAFTHSGAAGAFVLEGVAAGPWRLWAHAEDMRYAWSEPFDVASGTDEDGLELVLEPLRPTDRIEGLVVDPTGAPVADAYVVFLYQREHEGGASHVTSDAGGRFRILVYIDGIYRIIASDRQARYAENAVFDLRPGDRDVVVVMLEKRWIEVRVKDGEDPVHGLMVRAVGVGLNHSSRDWAPASPSDQHVRCDPPGFPFELEVRADGRRSVRLGPFDLATMDETIEVAFEIPSRVQGYVGANGASFAGARVHVVQAVEPGSRTKNGFPLRMERYTSAEGTTRADGSFELALELDPLERVFVRILADEWATVELGPMSVADATGTVHDVELTRGGEIEGRVLRPDGRDGAGVIVGINCGDGDARTVRAGPGGAYRFELLRPGRWQVGACETEHLAGSIWTTAEEAGTPIEWSCEVDDGRTTSFDLVLDR